MENNFKEPKFNTITFTCPHCQAIAQMNFITPSKLRQNIYSNLQDIKANYLYPSENARNRVNNIEYITDIYEKFANSFAICQNCKKISIWLNETMIYPKPRLTPTQMKIYLKR